MQKGDELCNSRNGFGKQIVFRNGPRALKYLQIVYVALKEINNTVTLTMVTLSSLENTNIIQTCDPYTHMCDILYSILTYG